MGDRVVLVGFDGAQTLDVTGPAEVFAAAMRSLDRRAYEVVTASIGGGDFRSSSGCVLASVRLEDLVPEPRDTVLVSGGLEGALRAAIGSRALLSWLQGAARTVRRIGSVCSGAFILASAGILDGRMAATHWAACDQLAAYFPTVRIDRNSIFVNDGNVWTSAGVTTGIDMAIAMVEEDHGRKTADWIAANLVLYCRRPGFQSQFSDVLMAQTTSSDPLGATIAWARTNLRDANAESLAERAGMSPRTFYRHCVKLTGLTPAKLVESLRIELARTLIATTSLNAKCVADVAGFGTAAQMRRAFSRQRGLCLIQSKYFEKDETSSADL